MAIQPPLSEIDLRDYFWVARDRLQVNQGRTVDGAASRAAYFESLIAGSTPQRQAGAASASELSDSERGQLYELLEQSIHQKPALKASYDGFRQLVEKSLPNAATSMASAIETVPISQVPAAVGTDLDTLIKSKPELATVFEPVLKKWQGEEDTRVARALKTTAKTASKR